MLLYFDDYKLQAERLADALGMPRHIIQRHCFPDGENRITLPPKLPGHVLICRSLDRPNEKLIELLLAAKTARTLGASTLTLITPYLCYMRQDIAFNPGEAVSQTIIGKYLAELFDNVITVDPHLHRITRLEQAVPATRAMSLPATALMSEYLNQHLKNPILIGPDSEAEQWVSAVATPHRWDYAVCQKIRKGDRNVEIALPDIALDDRSVVIIDDVASSGRTLAVASDACIRKNAREVDVLITHALLSDVAKQDLLQTGVRHIWSTDSVSDDSNVIQLWPLLKEAVLNLDEK